MIITLLPFFLAASKAGPESSEVWKSGAEVTYMIHNHASITYPDESDGHDRFFDLTGKMGCQQMYDTPSLSCSLHDIKVHTTLIDENKSQKVKADFIREDVWTKKFLQQDTFVIEFDKNGVNDVLVSKGVNQAIWGMIGAIGNSLDVGLDLTKKIEGDFIRKANETNGYCKTIFFVTRAAKNSDEENKLPNVHLFLSRRQNESLASSIEIMRKIEDNNCSFKRYSSFLHREVRKLKPQDFSATITSAENFMTISDTNFTSFSKTHMKITNFKRNTKYIVDESISLTLKDIKPIKCSENNEETSNTN